MEEATMEEATMEEAANMADVHASEKERLRLKKSIFTVLDPL